MTQVDQFESVFRAAFHDVFHYKEISIEKILVITDLQGKERDTYVQNLKRFLGLAEDSQFELVEFRGEETLAFLQRELPIIKPDLILTYRNLGFSVPGMELTIGDTLDFLLHGTSYPVLVMPHPLLEKRIEERDRVLTLTDHLNRDPDLINYSISLTSTNGLNYLLHVEDEEVFERYLEIISKIPSIDTEDARKKIYTQLCKEPEDYILSCARALRENEIPVHIEGKTLMGNHLREIREIIEEENIHVLVMRTRHDEQIALHGLAYPIVMGIREIPILML